MAFAQSYDTLDWLTETAAGTHDVHEIGQFDGVKVLEFKPHTQAGYLALTGQHGDHKKVRRAGLFNGRSGPRDFRASCSVPRR
jgi:hypothetical protein